MLLVAGELHLGDTALEVLNIGTGPAPALYAINDFYQGLRAFSAQANECQRLYTPPPRLRSIEDSRRMVSRVHNLSESRVAPLPDALGCVLGDINTGYISNVHYFFVASTQLCSLTPLLA